MSKKILIVESDTRLSGSIRGELEGKGFTVDETSDGKGAVERIRQSRPDLVVLAVDLSAGQNGYIICGKLKKDDDVKSIPVVIIGNPDGFAQHKKLKTRADEYIAKQSGDIDKKQLVERVGGLIGFPDPPAASNEVVDDESISLSDLVEAEEEEAPSRTDEVKAESGAEQIAVDSGQTTKHTALKAPSASAPMKSAAEAGEAREMRAKVSELQSALEDANTRASEHESKVRELETELETARTELETARAGSGGGNRDKEFFALKEARTKQDKEILRLKNELNEKEKEIVELRERETSLEQAQSESSGEVARRDAQIKTLTARADQLAAERKKLDQALMAAKE